VGLRTPRTCWLPPIASVSVPCSLPGQATQPVNPASRQRARVIEGRQLRPELYCHVPHVSKVIAVVPVSFGSRPFVHHVSKLSPTLLRRGCVSRPCPARVYPKKTLEPDAVGASSPPYASHLSRYAATGHRRRLRRRRGSNRNARAAIPCIGVDQLWRRTSRATRRP